MGEESRKEGERTKRGTKSEATLQSALSPGLNHFFTQGGKLRSRMAKLSSPAVDGFHRNINRPHTVPRRPPPCAFSLLRCKYPFLTQRLGGCLEAAGVGILKLPGATELRFAIGCYVYIFRQILDWKGVQMATGIQKHEQDGYRGHDHSCLPCLSN